MSPIETFMVAVALGCDAFAVGMGVGTRFCNPRQVFRLSFHFGLFQFIMPIAGWLIGKELVGVAQQWGPWIAFALLFFIGGKMLYESLRHGDCDGERECADPTRGMSLVVLSVATSIDALGVGLGLGLMGQSLLVPAAVIGIVALSMTWLAMKIGNRLSEKFGRRIESVGGLVLMAIAVKLLVF